MSIELVFSLRDCLVEHIVACPDCTGFDVTHSHAYFGETVRCTFCGKAWEIDSKLFLTTYVGQELIELIRLNVVKIRREALKKIEETQENKFNTLIGSLEIV
jgi:hypothetical protein